MNYPITIDNIQNIIDIDHLNRMTTIDDISDICNPTHCYSLELYTNTNSSGDKYDHTYRVEYEYDNDWDNSLTL